MSARRCGTRTRNFHNHRLLETSSCGIGNLRSGTALVPRKGDFKIDPVRCGGTNSVWPRPVTIQRSVFGVFGCIGVAEIRHERWLEVSAPSSGQD